MPKEILLRIPGQTKYSEVLKTKVWHSETSLDFIKLNNQVDFILIGHEHEGFLYFWLSIFGSPNDAKLWRYNLNYAHYSNQRGGYAEHNVTQHVRTLDESPKEIITKGVGFFVLLDIAKKMYKEKGCINLTIFKADTKDKRFKYFVK